jgi:ABC-type multidrug transport system fused ATPase/permease subunit
MNKISEIQKKIDELFEGTDPESFEVVTKVAKIIKPELRKRNIILILHTLISLFAIIFVICFAFQVPMSLFSMIIFILIANIILRLHIKGIVLIIQINEYFIIQKIRNYLRDYIQGEKIK